MTSYAKIEDGAELITVGQQLMEFYVRTIIESKLPDIRKVVIQENPHMDSDFIIESVNQEVEKLIPEICHKFNMVALLILDFIIRGDISEIRNFETKFEDLLDRTLLRHIAWDDFVNSIKEKLLCSTKEGESVDINNTIGNA